MCVCVGCCMWMCVCVGGWICVCVCVCVCVCMNVFVWVCVKYAFSCQIEEKFHNVDILFSYLKKKGLKLTDADQELYKNFPLVISERWQAEVIIINYLII